jgi:UDP-N-acetylglucosamine:LPS N-acetylglucosamine transferase
VISCRGARPELNEMRKFVAGASAGGHTNELLILLLAAESIWQRMPDIYVTTMPISAVAYKRYAKPVRVIAEADRKKFFGVLWVVVKSLFLVLRDRPGMVVTTGSLPLAIYCVFAKYICRASVIWIDSVAQVDEMSMSGKLMLRVADQCFVQWPEVAEKYIDARYSGEVM